MVSDVAALSPEEQRRWADELLPRAGPTAGAVIPPLQPAEVAADSVNGSEASPLRGVRFGPLSGPGPSGTRPEHLRDMLACGRRRSVNRLFAALRTTEALAEAGRLPDVWAVILRTRLVFLRKRHGTKPRPVRIGEVWRRVIAKNKLSKAAAPIRRAMLRAQQFAVLMPGGAEPLIHVRRCFREALTQDASLGIWCEVDVDVVNAFPSMEWSAVDSAIREEVPQLAHWSEWCHRESPIILPDGSEHVADRGAEQGDPEASVQCGAVIAVARQRGRASRMQAVEPGPSYVFDAWFADDGQAYVRPDKVDGYLQALDAELAKAGCTRGEGADVKSSVTLIGHPDVIGSLDGSWLTPYIERTCKVRAPNSSIEVLGSVVGTAAAVISQFDERVQATGAIHTAIEQLCDPAIELTLGRSCADVARVTHLLRTSGDIIVEGPVGEHDLMQQAFVERVLGGDLGSTALSQAALGLRAGGLGSRTAADSAIAAFVASRLEAAPLVAHLLQGMQDEGLPAEAVRAVYDSQLAAARLKLAESLSPERRERLSTTLDDGTRAAQERFDAMLNGRDISASTDENGGVSGLPRGGVVDEAGTDDPEHARTRSVPRLQRQIAAIIDNQRAAVFIASAQGDGRYHDMRRLQDLSDESVSHDWLWSLAPTSRHTLEPDVYVDAVRLRLGAAQSSAEQCRVCGRRCVVDGAHALCCAPGPSTKGHNEARDCVLALARRGDPHAESEVLGLLPAAPGARPADVLTHAAGGTGLVALDIGIASPDSQAAIAAGDGLEAMRKRKERVYAEHAEGMRQSGLAYAPLPWSCWGREHASTTAMLETLCRRAARRRGESNWRAVLRDFRADMGAVLARRASAMWRQCALSAGGG